MVRHIGVETREDLEYNRDFMKNYKHKKKYIRLNSSDLAKLKKHKRLSGRDFIIDVLEGHTNEIRVWGRGNIR